jgi:hypothetical protein
MKLTGAKKAAFIARMKAGRKRAAKNPSIRKAKKTIARGFGRELASQWASGKKTNRKRGKTARNNSGPTGGAVTVRPMGENFNVYIDNVRVDSFSTRAAADKLKTKLLADRRAFYARTKKNPDSEGDVSMRMAERLIRDYGWTKARAIWKKHYPTRAMSAKHWASARATATRRERPELREAKAIVKQTRKEARARKGPRPAHKQLSLFGNPRKKRNPDMEEAIRLYEQFHGRPPNNINEYELTEEYRSELAELGQLIELRFTLAGDDKAIPLTRFGKCQVACTEDGRNLYFVGGNTTVDVAALGIEPRDYVELGVCSYISYHTVKGFHDFEPMIYFHHFGEDTGRQPMLLYDGLNECLFIAGGDYTVQPAGIVN